MRHSLFTILLCTTCSLLPGAESAELRFRGIENVGSNKYVTYTFVPHGRSICYLWGRTIGSGAGVWAAFTEAHDFSLYIDSSNGFVNVKRRNLWTGLLRCYIYYHEPNEAISTIGISCSELIEGIREYYSGKWPSQDIDVKCYIKIGVRGKPGVYAGSQEDNPYAWIPSEPIVLRISKDGGRISVVGYYDRALGLEAEKNKDALVRSITPIEITQDATIVHTGKSDPH